MAVLVTGGGGFLGTALLPRLVARGEVIALRRPGTQPSQVDGVRWVVQDLAAPLSADLPERIDAVIHLAQSRRYREFPDGAIDVYEVNAGATVRLLEYCSRAGAASFTYASSGAVYAPGPEPVNEADAPQPAGANLVFAFCRSAARPILRPVRVAANWRCGGIVGVPRATVQ